jgi:hypothetical protein
VCVIRFFILKLVYLCDVSVISYISLGSFLFNLLDLFRFGLFFVWWCLFPKNFCIWVDYIFVLFCLFWVLFCRSFLVG